TATEADNITVIFKRDEISFLPGGEDVQTTYRLDPSKKPKVMYITAHKGPDKDRPIPFIYELAGDNLKLCWDTKEGKKQPSEFAAKKGSEFILFVLKRGEAREADKKSDSAAARIRSMNNMKQIAI